jgi:hypothetical protein
MEDLNLKLSHTLNLAGDITLNYAVPVSKISGFDTESLYVEVLRPIYGENLLVGEETLLLKPAQRGNYYYFALDGMTAVQMNDKVTAVLHGVKEGQTYVSPMDRYSIADYAYSQLNKEGSAESLKSLCAELLRYGSEAQIFKNYRTDALAREHMTEAHLAYLIPEEAVTFGNHNQEGMELSAPTVKWVGKALDLNTRVTIVYVVDLGGYKGEAENLSLKLRYIDTTGNTVEVALQDPTPYGTQEGRYAFRFDGLLAAELRTVVTARVFRGETPVSNTLSYSADTYGNGRTGQLLTLCKALFAYSDKAKAYFD